MLQDSFLVMYDCHSDILLAWTGKAHGCPPTASFTVPV